MFCNLFKTPAKAKAKTTKFMTNEEETEKMAKDVLLKNNKNKTRKFFDVV